MHPIKFFAPLSIAVLFACSDVNTSGTSEYGNTIGDRDPNFSDTGNNEYIFGECQKNVLDIEKNVLTKTADVIEVPKTYSEDTHKAYILQDGEGHYQVFIPNISDYCSVQGRLLTTRSGDTLTIEYGSSLPYYNEETGETVILGVAVTKCVCFSDHWFNIDAADKDVKYFKYGNNTYVITPKQE